MILSVTESVESLPELSSKSPRWRPIAMWVLVALIALSSLWAGVSWRGWWFRATSAIHFVDISRNWLWGTYTFQNIHDKDRSFLDTYDDVGIQDRGNNLWIDYAPARLLVNTCWAAWNHRTMPYVWHKSYRTTQDVEAIHEFHAFYLGFNMVMEALAAAGAFMLTRNVVGRAGGSDVRATTLGLIAGLLLWFNPAMILSAHCWPSGDMWIVPPFLWAIYFARIDRWFWAGVVLAIGVLFKGQQLFVILVMVLWPLFQLRWRPPLRLAAGFAGTFGLFTAGWTLTYIDPAGFRHISIPAAMLASLPLLILAAFLVLRWRVPKLGLDRVRITTVSMACFGAAGAAAFFSMWMFGTCFAWFDASYKFGTNHWPYMVMGVTSNLPGLMQGRFGWDGRDGPSYVLFYLDAAQQLPTMLKTFLYAIFMAVLVAGGMEAISPSAILFRLEVADPLPITLKTFLFSIFMVLLVISAMGIAMHDRRNSTRFLIAIVTPWLLFFTIPCQIHERYLLFAACTACVCIGHSVGTTLLGLFCTALTWLMTIHVMLNHGKLVGWNQLLNKMHPTWFGPNARASDGFAQTLRRFIDGTYPDIGWAVILTTLIFFYLTITPLWVRRKKVETPLPRLLPPEPMEPAPDRSNDPLPLDYRT